MNVQFHLIVSESGSIHTRKTKPDLKRDEVGIKMNLNLPDALFVKPYLQADVSIDPDQVTTYPLDTKVSQEIKDAVKSATGMDLAIQIIDPNFDDEI